MSEIIYNSLVAGLATCFGALIIVLTGNPKEKILSLMFGLAAGIMLGVVILDLLPSALELGTFRQGSTGFSIGIIIMLALNLLLSQFYSIKNKSINQKNRLLKMGYLVAIGIALHDLPEGVAIAAGYSAQESLGLIIAVAIGLHNIPEGMATAIPLKMGGVSYQNILLINLFVSLFTPLGAFLGIILVNISKYHIAMLLAVAAGAMTFIVVNELLPESRRRHPNYSTLGSIIGFMLILGLSVIH